MRRILFRCGPLNVYSFPALLYVGIVLGVFGQEYAAVRLHLEASRVFVGTLLTLVPALLGARLLYLVLRWSAFRAGHRRIFGSTDGGAAMYGGLLLAVPASVPVLRALGLRFGAFWDSESFTMLIGLIVARGGCLLNGCCSGRATTRWFGLTLADHRGVSIRRMPTQILESAWGLFVLVGAVAVLSAGPFSGAVFLFTIGAYGAGRFLLEPLRQEQDLVLGISLHRALAATMAGACAAAFFIVWSIN